MAGLKPGRTADGETILLWHRGLSPSDIALGHAMLEKAKALRIGQRLRYARGRCVVRPDPLRAW